MISEISLHKQCDTFFSGSWTNGERQRNEPCHCKTTKAIDQSKTAAQAGPLNGGKDKKRIASSFRGSNYYEAVSWFKKKRDTCARPIVKTLCRKFNLKPLEACQAVREANGGAQ